MCEHLARRTNENRLSELFVQADEGNVGETEATYDGVTFDPEEDWDRDDISQAESADRLRLGNSEYLLHTRQRTPSYLRFVDASRVVRIACEFVRGDDGTARTSFTPEAALRRRAFARTYSRAAGVVDVAITCHVPPLRDHTCRL